MAKTAMLSLSSTIPLPMLCLCISQFEHDGQDSPTPGLLMIHHHNLSENHLSQSSWSSRAPDKLIVTIRGIPFPRTNAHHQPPAAVSLPFRTPWLIPELRNSRPFLFFRQQMFFRSLSRPLDLYFKTKILFISANPVFSRSLVLLASHISSFRKNSRFSSLAPNFRASKGLLFPCIYIFNSPYAI
ncbi:hypothetical protein ACLOJK_035207 [Asimina triloba]